MNTATTGFIKSIFCICFFTTIVFTSCKKQSICIGEDCIFPEATVAVDSIINNRVYVTLLNSEGNSFAYPLSLSPAIDETDFMSYAGIKGSTSTDMKSDGRLLKVYYVSDDQSYVQNNATYINANSTNLEIVAFGNDLNLTY